MAHITDDAPTYDELTDKYNELFHRFYKLDLANTRFRTKIKRQIIPLLVDARHAAAHGSLRTADEFMDRTITTLSDF